jgi:nucleotide-binding universal stress UspA family protein
VPTVSRRQLVPALRASEKRPVLLVTLDVPLIERAAHFAVESAVEAGQPLLVVNAVESALLPCSTLLGYEYIPHADVEASLRGPAELARSLGVDVERLRVASPRPVAAVLQVVVERNSGLLVFGADPARMRPRRYRKARGAFERSAPCLVWLD